MNFSPTETAGLVAGVLGIISIITAAVVRIKNSQTPKQHQSDSNKDDINKVTTVTTEHAVEIKNMKEDINEIKTRQDKQESKIDNLFEKIIRWISN